MKTKLVDGLIGLLFLHAGWSEYEMQQLREEITFRKYDIDQWQDITLNARDQAQTALNETSKIRAHLRLY
ncbi:MAG: hypothetical protein JWO82_371 [Akkermansiaceae bacterium]|nr:hypothetical protein [Akkermansiaceae bacterium]